jgi:hypothetical protein
MSRTKRPQIRTKRSGRWRSCRSERSISPPLSLPAPPPKAALLASTVQRWRGRRRERRRGWKWRPRQAMAGRGNRRRGDVDSLRDKQVRTFPHRCLERASGLDHEDPHAPRHGGGHRAWAAPSQRLSRLLPKRRCWHRRRRGGRATAWEEERVEVKAPAGDDGARQ